MAVIGLDLGGTKLAGAIVQPDGNIMNKITIPVNKEGGNEVSRMITQLIREETGFAHAHGMHIDSVGCCVPGIVNINTGVVWAPNIRGWDDFPLAERIREEIGAECPAVILDNDRACCIMGEVWQGCARGCKNAIFLAVGTGIGAGILTDGNILRGSSDIAGAIGWLALDRPFKDKYTGYGCFEYNASGDGLIRIARELLENSQAYTGFLRTLKPGELTTKTIFEAYRMNDALAVQVVKHAIAYWGMTVANLVSLFNPEKIIFGGGVFGPAVALLDDILSEARKWGQPISIQQVKLEPSLLAGDAGLIGAGYLALTSPSGIKK